jgi:hypothetical protein
MHSRVFKVCLLPSSDRDDGDITELIEIAKENNTISPDDYFEHWFTTSHADYVDDDPNPSESLKWLFSDLSCNQRPVETDETKRTFILKEGFKESYFENKFLNFKSLLDQAKAVTLSDFIADYRPIDLDMGFLMYRLKSAYLDDGGFYIDLADEYDGVESELIPLDTFLRRAEIGKTYYVVGSIDYHF